jgi:hypothetical protein
MVDIGSSLFLLAKVLLMFVFFYIFIPSRVIRLRKDDNTFLDVVFISFVHATLITIVVVHILSFLKVYDTFSLVISYVAVIFVALSIRKKTKEKISSEITSNVMVRLFKFVDNESNYSDRFKRWKARTNDKFKDTVQRSVASIKSNPLRFIVIILVVLAAVYIRFGQSINHIFLGESDCYVHLAWSKYIGSNSIYQDGIYPYGYEAIVSALNKLSFMDSYSILRFLGPIQGIMIVMSIYYILKKYNRKGTMLIWSVVLVYVLGSGLPVDITRQISALPQEFASIFLLPGLYFFNTYLNVKEKKYLYYSAECLCLTLLIHPYVTVFMVLSFAVAFIVNISFVKDIRAFFNMILIMILAAAVGVLPLLVGMLKGMPFHSSLKYIIGAAKLPSSGVNINFLDPNRILMLFIILSILVLVLGFVYLIRLKTLKDQLYIRHDIIIIIISLLLYLLYKAQSFNLPVIMDPNRIGIFLAMYAVVVIGIFIELLCLLIKNNKLNIAIQFLCFLLIAFTIYSIGKIAMPIPNQYEYDAAGSAYLNIKRDYPTFDWTIVSPVEQYQEVLGYGWHYNLFQFILDLEDKNKSKINIPTDYVFIYVEKYPLGSDKKVTIEDSKKSVPVITGELSKYYTDDNSRRILEAKMYFYMENFRLKNKEVTIYYDDKDMRIYLVTQNSKAPLNLKQV